jgi:hypothetical protein
VDRITNGVDNGWLGVPGSSWVEYRFSEPERVRGLRFVFDSDLSRDPADHRMRSNYALDDVPTPVSPVITRAYRVDVQGADGQWRTLLSELDNHQRLVRYEVDVVARALQFVPEGTWGAPAAHVFAWDVIG